MTKLNAFGQVPYESPKPVSYKSEGAAPAPASAGKTEALAKIQALERMGYSGKQLEGLVTGVLDQPTRLAVEGKITATQAAEQTRGAAEAIREAGMGHVLIGESGENKG